MVAQMWRFVLQNKQHFFRFSIYPFATGIVIGSCLKEYFEDLIYPNSSRKITLPNQSSNLEAHNHTLERYGIPSGGPLILRYSNHVVQYDTSKKVPLWVLEHITNDNLKGNAERSQCSFQQDNNIPEHLQGKNEDYLGSGFARGHMIPASDIKDSQKGMKETFLLTNIVPQDYDNNSGFWYRMENYCRNLTNKFSDIYVVSGPLFLSDHDTDERKIVKIQLIGKNEIAVPSHLFKVILAADKDKPVGIAAFVVPNARIADDKVLKDFQVTLERLEGISGFVFFPNLPKHTGDLCIKEGCKMLSKLMANMNILKKNLKRATSMDDLDKIWRMIQEKNIKVDKKFMEMYWSKRKDIAQNYNN